jgi:L-threonylcarbamoyladenylate synthase
MKNEMGRVLNINPADPESDKIQLAAGIIQKGGIIAYPTETVYGLGANIYNQTAVNRLYTLKGRDQQKALIVIIDSPELLQNLVAHISDQALLLIKHFWPGPLTMIFSAKPSVPEFITGGGKTIAIRIPNSPICLELIKACEVPLTSTSANLAGGQNPTTADEVLETFGARLDLIIDGGPSHSNITSTVLDVTQKEVHPVRQGAIAIETIKKVCKIDIF